MWLLRQNIVSVMNESLYYSWFTFHMGIYPTFFNISMNLCPFSASPQIVMNPTNPGHESKKKRGCGISQPSCEYSHQSISRKVSHIVNFSKKSCGTKIWNIALIPAIFLRYSRHGRCIFNFAFYDRKRRRNSCILITLITISSFEVKVFRAFKRTWEHDRTRQRRLVLRDASREIQKIWHLYWYEPDVFFVQLPNSM
jgi:hypothetical protein